MEFGSARLTIRVVSSGVSMLPMIAYSGATRPPWFSNEYFASDAVKCSPSCQCTSDLRLKVYLSAAELISQLSARCGRIWSFGSPQFQRTSLSYTWLNIWLPE